MLGESIQKVGILLALMGLVAFLEVWLPLRASNRRSRAVNLGLAGLFLALNLLMTAPLLLAAGWMSSRQLGLLPLLKLDAVSVLVVSIVLLDLGAYLVHVLMHKLPWMWRFHRVHHSDSMVDVTTAFRQHPLETLARFAFTALPALPALALGVPPVAIALYRTLSGLAAIVEHANVRLHEPLDRLLTLVIVGPRLHKLHHSTMPAETDSNYGNIFSIFDRLFRTFTPAERALAVTYGLEGYGDPSRQRFAALIAEPFRNNDGLQ